MDFKSEITRIKRVLYFLNRTSTTIINNLVTTLSALTDVSIYEPDGGQVLMYNESTGLWENEQINQAHVIQGAGVSVTQRSKLNFVGATVADDPSSGATKVTIAGGGSIDGSGTTNELTYWVDADTVGALAVATYPSLTEISYSKGVTSSIQTQFNAKAPLASPTFTGTVTVPTPSNSTDAATKEYVDSSPQITYSKIQAIWYHLNSF